MPTDVIKIQRRVLRLVDKYLAEQDKDELVGADGGLMTWGELRQHIEVATKYLRVRERPAVKEKWKWNVCGWQFFC
jgi:hypothetical protein